MAESVAERAIKKAEQLAAGEPVEVGGIFGDQDWVRAAVLARELQSAQERLEAVDVQLGRHLCYTGEMARRIFWKGVDTYLAQHTEEPELTEAEKAEEAAAIPEADYCPTWQADRDQIRSTLQDADRRHLSEGWLRAKVTQLLLQANELEAELQAAQQRERELREFIKTHRCTNCEAEALDLFAAQRTEEPCGAMAPLGNHHGTTCSLPQGHEGRHSGEGVSWQRTEEPSDAR